MFLGDEVSWDDHRFSALIAQRVLTAPNDRTYSIICSGAFITPQIILTASICFNNWDGDESQLMVKSHFRDHMPPDAWGNGNREKVSAVFTHPDATSQTHPVNVALVKLKIPQVTDILLLPRVTEDLKFIDREKELNIFSIGGSFGLDQERNLKRAAVKLYHDRCGETVKFHDPKTEVCSTIDEFRLCVDDYGAPVVANTTRGLIHIAHFAGKNYFCHDEMYQYGDQVTFVRTSSIISWILKTVHKNTRGHNLDHLIEEWLPTKH